MFREVIKTYDDPFERENFEFPNLFFFTFFLFLGNIFHSLFVFKSYFLFLFSLLKRVVLRCDRRGSRGGG
jgi:hypothetical protein